MTKHNIDLISPVLRAFIPNSPTKTPEITNLQQHEFYDQFDVLYASPVSGAEEVLKTFFVGIEIFIDPVEGRAAHRVTLSKINLPTSYDLFSILKYADQHRDKGMLLGIGPKGPVFLDVENHLTHALIGGSTGYGKTSFAHLILAQALTFQDYAVHIVDPKGLDTARYKGLNGVGIVANSYKSFSSLLRIIVLEIQVRKNLYDFFKHPPKTLTEYNRLRLEHGTKLPELKRTLVYVDEYKQVVSEWGGTHIGNVDNLDIIARQGRAFGIHLLLVSQRLRDIRSSIASQSDCFFSFHGGGSVEVDDTLFSMKKLQMQGIPGRMTVKIHKTGEEFVCQVPYVSAADAFAAAKKLNKRPPLKNHGFVRLNFTSPDYLASQLPKDIESGVDLASMRKSDLECQGRPVNYTHSWGRASDIDLWKMVHHVGPPEEEKTKNTSINEDKREDDEVLTPSFAAKTNSNTSSRTTVPAETAVSSQTAAPSNVTSDAEKKADSRISSEKWDGDLIDSDIVFSKLLESRREARKELMEQNRLKKFKKDLDTVRNQGSNNEEANHEEANTDESPEIATSEKKEEGVGHFKQAIELIRGFFRRGQNKEENQ